jgi:hypothetical protein
MSDLNKQEIVMDEFLNCGFSVMIPYVQHICASGTNAGGVVDAQPVP